MTGARRLGRGLGAAGVAALLASGVLAQTPDAPDSLRESFRNWVVNCATTPADAAQGAGQRVCEVLQQLDDQASGQRVLAFSVRLSAAGEPVAVLVAPFGLRLSEGLRVQVNDAVLGQFAFDTCLPTGCITIGQMDPALISAMQDGTEAHVIMVSRQGEAVRVPISLIGFTAALTRLRALSDG